MYKPENPFRFGIFVVVIIFVFVGFVNILPDSFFEDPLSNTKTNLMLSITIMIFATIEGFSTYIQVVDNRNALVFAGLQNEIENCYSPLYHIFMNRHFLSVIETSDNPEGTIHYEADERQSLNNIFEKYSYLIPMDIYHDWKGIDHDNVADDGGLDIPFGYVENFLIDHESKVSQYREITNK